MNIHITTSTRSDGSMKSAHDSNTDDANQARINFLRKNNMTPESTTLVRLKYGGDDYCRYITADDQYKGDGITRESNITADAVVVTQPDYALLLPLADCIGAVIHDPIKNILMVSHLGRHNLEQFGGTRSIEFLQKHHNVNPHDLNIWLSPAAGKTNYPLFKFENRSLHEAATEQLIKAGVLPKNIKISPIDSSLDGKYYSHSQFLKDKQDNDGRFAIAAVLTD